MDDSLVDSMLVELRRASDDLVSAGRAQAQLVSKQFGRSSSIRACLDASRRLAGLVPRLLDETPMTLDRGLPEIIEVRTPRRASPSRHPRDFVASPAGMVPTRWLAEISGEGASLSHLSILFDAVSAQQERLLAAQSRLRKFVGDAAKSLAGESEYAAADLASLRDLLGTVDGTMALLLRAREQVARRMPPRRRHPARPHRGWPSTPAWTALRRMLRDVDMSTDTAKYVVAETLAHPVSVADLPFLYQRWVALQVLDAFAARQWRTGGDPTGALWLGGCVKLSRGKAEVEMWIEPRLLPFKSKHRHPSGMASRLHSAEQTPDIVLLVRAGFVGEEAYVLDATLSSDAEVLRSKAKYLDTLQLGAPRRVTGVMLPRAPLKSWAVSPVRGWQCRPFDLYGHSGVIPLRPDAALDRSRGLSDWLSELTESLHYK